MQLHELKSFSKTRKRRAGRGGKRGTTSGRGTKGQRARAGRRMRPELRDTLKKIPKLRGYGKHRAQSVIGAPNMRRIVNLSTLDANFKTGEVVSPKSLSEKKLIKRVSGSRPEVKILASGKLSKALKVEDCLTSKGAIDAIKKAGGEVVSKASL